MSLPITRKRRLFCFFVCHGIPTYYGVGALSIPISHGIHLVISTHFYFFWTVCHPNKTFPSKKPEQEPQNRFSPLPTTRPCPLLPLTHDPPSPVLAGHKLVMFGTCACSTLVYVQNLPAAHAFVMVWRLICTFCRPSLTSYDVSYFLIFHPLWPAPFRDWALLDYRLFFLQPTLLLLSTVLLPFPTVLLCHSCCNVIWPKPAGPLWTCCLFFSQ